MNTKAWIIFGAIIVVVFGALIAYSGRDRVDVSKIDQNTILSASKSSGNIGDHVFGNKDAKVVLVEYGDFQCPGCGAAHPIVKPLTEKYKDELAFVFRNFPLTNLHPNARAAAAAVEAAGLMGKYWDMHNTVFESQNEWSEASENDRTSLFAGYATHVGLKKSSFTDLLDSKSTQINQKISFDQALGRKVKVDGTPTFFLNGRKLSSDEYADASSLEKTLLAEFKKKDVNVSTESNDEKS